MPPIQTLLLSFGHVESARFCFVPFKHREGFATVQLAVVDLFAITRDILRTRARRGRPVRGACCRETVSALPDAARCATCGKKIARPVRVTLASVAEYLESYTTRVQDESLEDCEAFDRAGWEPGGMEGVCAVVDHVDGLLDVDYQHFDGDTVLFAVEYEDGDGAIDAEDVRTTLMALAGVSVAGNAPP